MHKHESAEGNGRVTRSCSHFHLSDDSVDRLLRRSSSPPLCCCEILFGLFSPSPVVHITWIPWVSLVKSTLLRNGVRNQSINQSILRLSLLSLPLSFTSQRTVWGLIFVFQAKINNSVSCVLKAFGSGCSYSRPFAVRLNGRDGLAVVLITLPTLHKRTTVDYLNESPVI